MPVIWLVLVGGMLIGALIGALAVHFRYQSRLEALAQKKLGAKQEAFIAIASHYLLTPISIIQSAIIRLEEKPNLEMSARQELYGIILSGEKRLYIIAEQMLLATKLVGGQLSLALRVGQLHQPVIDAIREVEAIANQKKVALHPTIAQVPPIELQMDAKLIQTATVALLDNAIKFSKEGGTVEIEASRDDDWAIIKVSDKGIGFNAEQHTHATEKFYRGTPPYSFDYEGMGLGLHVAYVIVTAHGGDLSIESRGAGKGSVVQIKIPLDAS